MKALQWEVWRCVPKPIIINRHLLIFCRFRPQNFSIFLGYCYLFRIETKKHLEIFYRYGMNNNKMNIYKWKLIQSSSMSYKLNIFFYYFGFFQDNRRISCLFYYYYFPLLFTAWITIPYTITCDFTILFLLLYKNQIHDKYY